jgi:glycerol-3-phosphate acyltransferase PlsY
LFIFALLILAAYFVGSIPTAYLVARWRRGIDIRQFGSGNVGASNVKAAVSGPWSVAVSIFDTGKGALMVWLAHLLGMGTAQQAIIGLAAIIGHNWTVFLNFQGGRGIFTSFGVITMLAPKVGLVALILSYLFAPFHQLALGVFIGLLTMPVLSSAFAQPFSVAEPSTVTIAYLAILAIALLRRLTAPKSALAAGVSMSELLINRLLFDRDIKDREAWLNQVHPNPKATK